MFHTCMTAGAELSRNFRHASESDPLADSNRPMKPDPSPPPPPAASDEYSTDDGTPARQRSFGSRVKGAPNLLWQRALDWTDKKTRIDDRLHDASQAGNMKRVKYLLEQKRDVNVNGLYRQLTSLQYAIQQQHFEIIQYLVLEHDADVALGMNGGAYCSACLVGNLTGSSIVPGLAVSCQMRRSSCLAKFM